MPADPIAQKPVTAADYLVMERASRDKHVLWDGEVFAMAGAGLLHNRLVKNVLVALGAQLRDKPCEPFPSDLRVFVPSRNGYVYPDVTVACAPLEMQDPAELDVLLNPRLLIEVLSDSTEAFDRGEKFEGYRSIVAMSDYLLIATKRRHVDHYRRQVDGSWNLRSYGANEEVPLESIGCGLALDEVYRRTEL